MKNNDLILSAIIQLLTFEKIKKNSLNMVEGFKDEKIIFGATDLDDKDGFFAGILSRFVIHSEASIDDLIKANIIEPSGTYYFFDENDDQVKVDVEIENGKKLFFANGYEVEDEDILPKYKIHKNTIKEAIKIFDTVKDFVEKSRFTFIDRSVRYVIPLYVAIIFKALRAIKNEKNTDISEVLTEMLHEDKLVNEIKKTEVSELNSFAIEAKNLDTGDWKDTVSIHYNS